MEHLQKVTPVSLVSFFAVMRRQRDLYLVQHVVVPSDTLTRFTPDDLHQMLFEWVAYGAHKQFSAPDSLFGWASVNPLLRELVASGMSL